MQAGVKRAKNKDRSHFDKFIDEHDLDRRKTHDKDSENKYIFDTAESISRRAAKNFPRKRCEEKIDRRHRYRHRRCFVLSVNVNSRTGIFRKIFAPRIDDLIL